MWISIPNGVIILSLTMICIGLYYGDWRRRPKPLRFPPPRHFNCRCETIPLMRSALEEVKKKMRKNMKNSIEQMYGSPKYGRTFYNWQFDPPILGKERRMEKESEKKLEKKYVRIPNKHLSDAVQQMFLDRGVTFGGKGKTEPDDYPVKTYGDRACLVYQGSSTGSYLTCSPTEFWEEDGYTEISISELADILAKPKHTLMTADELQGRLQVINLGTQSALVLSIDKWERLLKKENWSELIESPKTYLCADTCGLCSFHKDNPKTEEYCGSCPLILNDGYVCGDGGRNHPWGRVSAAVKNKDREQFEYHANDLLKIMRRALDELRRPKVVYKIGQWFRHRDRNLYQLVKGGDKTHGSVPIALVNGNGGTRWSGAIPVVNVMAISGKEFEEIADDNPKEFTPVTVHIAVIDRNKK